jgi:hypothetical protein
MSATADTARLAWDLHADTETDKTQLAPGART